DTYSMTACARPKQARRTGRGIRRTTMSVPRWARSLSATMAPRKVSHTNSQRESSSEIRMPELKPYRSTTLPNTSTRMASNSPALMTSSRRQYRSMSRFISGPRGSVHRLLDALHFGAVQLAQLGVVAGGKLVGHGLGRGAHLGNHVLGHVVDLHALGDQRLAVLGGDLAA